ncbi:hypothetical protein, partial [Staphylococcus ureilyticus]|uniref:hypothetical protein n=1 Tax=Staphylococcus ureilyticus TaxID=94138 RepID=UPI0021570E7D
ETTFTITVTDTTTLNSDFKMSNSDKSSNIVGNRQKDGLPNTGGRKEGSLINTIFGGIIAIFGSLLLFKKRKKKNNI